MKKIIVGILAIMYMTVSSGIAMEIHYCMGKKAGIDYFGSSAEKCGKCGMKEKKGGCCHDEYKLIKLEDLHKKVINDIVFAPDEVVTFTTYPLYNWKTYNASKDVANNINAPPDYTKPDACIMNCIFRI